jgi:hypothetical protein
MVAAARDERLIGRRTPHWTINASLRPVAVK